MHKAKPNRMMWKERLNNRSLKSDILLSKSDTTSRQKFERNKGNGKILNSSLIQAD